MPKENFLRTSWGGGLASPDAYGRVDLDRMQSTSEVLLNVTTPVLGGLRVRPGMQHLRVMDTEDPAVMETFSVSKTDTATMIFLPNVLEIEIDEVAIERPAVSSTVTNGGFASLTGWDVVTTTGSTAAINSGALQMAATARGAQALVRQQVTTSTPNVEHALRIVVLQGELTFSIGSSSGDDDYVKSSTLLQGTHSLAFTPTGSYWVEFSTRRDVISRVGSCTVEPAGRMQVPSPWGADNLRDIRCSQSIDVVFVACRDVWQHRIERRGVRSWSIARYFANDGPFTIGRTAPIKLKPDVLTGNGTLTASGNLFQAGHVGSLFRLFHSGQRVETDLAGEDEYSDSVRITGVDDSRAYNPVVTGTYVGTITPQRSTDGEDSGFGGNGLDETDERFNNSIAWRRSGFLPGQYTSGIAHVSLRHNGGGGYGICRITKVNSPTSADIEILRRFQQVTFTDDWREGEWSPVQTLPSAVGLCDGRLAWAGDDRLWMSVSDAYASFDPEKTGDSAPIQRYVATGEGGAYSVNNLLVLGRLIVLTDTAEVSARSSSLDEALKPDGITLKDASSQGSARVRPVRVDRSGFFVQSTGMRVYRLQFAADAQDYSSDDMCELIPEIGEPGIVKLAVQRQPDTRIYALRSDGTLAILTYYFQGQSQVAAWLEWDTDGLVKDIVIKPTQDADEVHLLVERANASGTYLAREKVASEKLILGGDNNRIADAHVWSTSADLRSTVTGLDHLNGREVVVWADGKVQSRKTVSGGSITLTTPARNVLVGLAYEWRVKSTKLAYAAGAGTALGQKKRVEHLMLLLRNTHINGIKVGGSFEGKMDGLPRMQRAVAMSEDTVFDEYDMPSQEFPGDWDTDSRICLKGEAPYPCSVLALVMTINTQDKA